MRNARRPTIPVLPADARGFIAVRPDRTERRAMFDRDGRLEASFAFGATDVDIAASLAPAGLRLEAGTVLPV